MMAHFWCFVGAVIGGAIAGFIGFRAGLRFGSAERAVKDMWDGI